VERRARVEVGCRMIHTMAVRPVEGLQAESGQKSSGLSRRCELSHLSEATRKLRSVHPYDWAVHGGRHSQCGDILGGRDVSPEKRVWFY